MRGSVEARPGVGEWCGVPWRRGEAWKCVGAGVPCGWRRRVEEGACVCGNVAVDVWLWLCVWKSGVGSKYEYEWWAANRGSQRLAHSSTDRYAGGLNFRVRDGYGCCPAAVAALTPTTGNDPVNCRVVGVRIGSCLLASVWPMCTCNPGNAWTRSCCGSQCMSVAWSVSARGLNVSLP